MFQQIDTEGAVRTASCPASPMQQTMWLSRRLPLTAAELQCNRSPGQVEHHVCGDHGHHRQRLLGAPHLAAERKGNKIATVRMV